MQFTQLTSDIKEKMYDFMMVSDSSPAAYFLLGTIQNQLNLRAVVI